MKIGDTIKFRLGGNIGYEGEGTFIKVVGEQIFLRVTKPITGYKVGETIPIWPEEIIK